MLRSITSWVFDLFFKFPTYDNQEDMDIPVIKDAIVMTIKTDLEKNGFYFEHITDKDPWTMNLIFPKINKIVFSYSVVFIFNKFQIYTSLSEGLDTSVNRKLVGSIPWSVKKENLKMGNIVKNIANQLNDLPKNDEK